MKYNRLIAIVVAAGLAFLAALCLVGDASAQEVCIRGDYKYEWEGENWVWVNDNPTGPCLWWVDPLQGSDEHKVCWALADGCVLEWWCVKYATMIQTLPPDQQCFITPWWDLSHVTAKVDCGSTPIKLVAFGAAGASLAQSDYPWELTLLGIAGIALGCLLAHILYLRRS